MERTPGVVAPERLAALERSGLALHPRIPAFDRLTAMAANLSGAPIAIVTLVDAYRSSFAGAFGLDEDGDRPAAMPVGDSFCQFVVAGREEWVVDDVASEPLLCDLPPSKELEAAAWAGFPVRDPDGHVLESLCVIDRVVRHWSGAEIELFRHVADAVSTEIALRCALREAEDASARAATHAAESDRHAREARRQAHRAEERAAEVGDLARTLQESLLPTRIPRMPGLEIGARYRAGAGGTEVLGDFYDVFPIPDGWGLVVGDVCGKGVVAARTTALARSTVRAVAHGEDDPEVVLTTLNDVLHDWFGDRRSFVTAAYAALRHDGNGFRATVASAGHPAGFVLSATGEVTALTDGGRVLGLLPDTRIAVESMHLRRGDSLILFTDGVTESTRRSDRVQFEEEGVADALRGTRPGSTAEEIAELVSAAALAHADGQVQDDTAVLVVRSMVGAAGPA